MTMKKENAIELWLGPESNRLYLHYLTEHEEWKADTDPLLPSLSSPTPHFQFIAEFPEGNGKNEKKNCGETIHGSGLSRTGCLHHSGDNMSWKADADHLPPSLPILLCTFIIPQDF
jgi:hypothetical protein